MKTTSIAAVSRFGRLMCTAAVAALLFAPGVLHARTWHSAQTGATFEGELVAKMGDNVKIQSDAGKIYTVPIASLTAEDQAFLGVTGGSASAPASAPAVQQVGSPAASSSAATPGGSLAILTPPISVKGSPVTGKGDGRKATLTLTNNGSKSVKGYVLDESYITADGKVAKSVPYTNSGAFESADGVLKKGKTHVQEIDSFFMEDDTASVGGVVTEVTFEDGSTWPALPAKPAQNGSDPLSAVVMGMIGTGEESVPAVAWFNYTAKDVKSLSYTINYLDADGKVLAESCYGSMSTASILDAGKGTLISGGEAPPVGAVSVKIVVSDVDFTDGSKWAPGK